MSDEVEKVNPSGGRVTPIQQAPNQVLDPNGKGNPYSLQYSGYGYTSPGGYSPGIVTGTPADWFGPLNPMSPTAPPEVDGRQMDFPSGYNLDITPRAYEAIQFWQLRAMADSYDVLRTIIETRKDQMVRLNWNIKARENAQGKKMVKPDDPVLTEIRDFFTMPDGEEFWDAWLRRILEDLFVIDAPTLYIRRNRGGKMIGLDPMDGATIKRVIDDWGKTPQAPIPAYMQILKGLPARSYTTDNMIYRPRNVRNHKVLGYSHVEQIVMTINIALRRETFLLQYYTEGNMPEALIGAPENWSVKQIKEFQNWMDSTLAGETGARRRARIVPGGIGKTYINTKEGALTNDTDEWLTRICCFAFSIAPTPFVRQVNRATAESQKEQALEEGLAPIQKWVKSLMDYIIWKEWKRRDIEFAFEVPDDVNAADQAKVLTEYVKTGVYCINQALDKLGEDPIQGGDQHLALLPTGWVAIAPTNQFGAAGGAQGVGEINDDLKPKGNVRDHSGPTPDTSAPPDPGQAPGVSDPNPKIKPPAPKPDEAKEPKPPGIRNPAARKFMEVSKLADIPFGKELTKRSPRKLISVPIDNPVLSEARESVAKEINEIFQEMGVKAQEQVASALRQMNKASWFDGTIARKIAESVDLSAFSAIPGKIRNYLVSAANNAAESVLSNYEEASSLVTDALSMVVDRIRRRAYELVGLQEGMLPDVPVLFAGAEMSIATSTVNMIERSIDRGIGEGLTADTVAAGMAELVFGSGRAELIAGAEVNRANSIGVEIGAQLLGTIGISARKAWITAGDSLVCADICAQNELDGFIPMTEAFQSGDQMTPGHPKCRCNIEIRTH